MPEQYNHSLVVVATEALAEARGRVLEGIWPNARFLCPLAWAGHPGTEPVPVEGDDVRGLHLPQLVHGDGLAHGRLLRHLDPHHVLH